MKNYKCFLLLVTLAVFSSCSHNEQEIRDNTKIAMPEYFKKVTGYDSIQLVFGGRSKYNKAKKDYDVTWDSLYANFCYPNKWELEKFKKDTFFIHDTIYTSKKYGNVNNVYIGGK